MTGECLAEALADAAAVLHMNSPSFEDHAAMGSSRLPAGTSPVPRQQPASGIMSRSIVGADGTRDNANSVEEGQCYGENLS
jgi:hypothetical protein